MPCGNTYCKNCIQKIINKKFTCKCESSHDQLKVDELKVNQQKIDEIEKNNDEINDEIYQKLLKFSEHMKSEF